MDKKTPPQPAPAAPRFSSPLREAHGRQVIDVSTYVPHFLLAINNPLSRGASQKYIDLFGIGIVEWRIISTLAAEPEISATRICEIVALEKSSTSRGLKSLDDKGLVDSNESPTDPRRKLWWLNAAGFELHDKVLSVALERERRLLEGIDGADLEITLRVLRQMQENVKHLDE